MLTAVKAKQIQDDLMDEIYDMDDRQTIDYSLHARDLAKKLIGACNVSQSEMIGMIQAFEKEALFRLSTMKHDEWDSSDFRDVVRSIGFGIAPLLENEFPGSDASEKTVTISIDRLAGLLRSAANKGHEASWGDHSDSGIAWHVLKDAGII